MIRYAGVCGMVKRAAGQELDPRDAEMLSAALQMFSEGAEDRYRKAYDRYMKGREAEARRKRLSRSLLAALAVLGGAAAAQKGGVLAGLAGTGVGGLAGFGLGHALAHMDNSREADWRGRQAAATGSVMLTAPEVPVAPDEDRNTKERQKDAD